MGWLRRWLAASLMVWLSNAAVVLGQRPESPGQPSQDPPGYQKLIGQAVSEFDAGNFEEARSLFTRAHELYPNARTHRGLGFVEFELRNYGESIKHLEAALTSEVKPLTDRLRKDTEGVLSRARNFVGRVVLEAEPEPSQVLVDDLPVEVSDGQALLLRVGDHVIELRARGYAPERRRLSLKGGEEQVLRVVFSRPTGPLDDAAGASRIGRGEAATGNKGDDRRWYRSPWLWTAVGLVVAGAAAGTGIALAERGGEDLPPPVGVP